MTSICQERASATNVRAVRPSPWQTAPTRATRPAGQQIITFRPLLAASGMDDREQRRSDP